MAESTEGIALRRIDYSETSLIVHFYTPDFGQVGALAKGAKRPRSSFQGGVDLLTRNQIVFARRGPGGLATLTESALLDDFSGLRADLGRLTRGQYVAELVSAFTTEEDPNPRLYHRLVQTLGALAAGTGDCVALTIGFELGLLADVGYMIDWGRCVECSREVETSAGASFSVTAGGVLCRACAASRGGIRLGPGVLAAAASLAAGGHQAMRLRLSQEQVKPLGRAAGQYITHLIGRPPRMLQYLDGWTRGG